LFNNIQESYRKYSIYYNKLVWISISSIKN
jgi:hypothetical protein